MPAAQTTLHDPSGHTEDIATSPPEPHQTWDPSGHTVAADPTATGRHGPGEKPHRSLCTTAR
eukprot:3712565-Pyramimonas_sp.AAC.1